MLLIETRFAVRVVGRTQEAKLYVPCHDHLGLALACFGIGFLALASVWPACPVALLVVAAVVAAPLGGYAFHKAWRAVLAAGGGGGDEGLELLTVESVEGAVALALMPGSGANKAREAQHGD